MRWVYDDGGRAASGRRGTTGDCVVRAVAIALQLDYDTVYRDLYDRQRAMIARRRKLRHRASANNPSPRTGVDTKVLRDYLAEHGWVWTATMRIGSGTTVHLAAGELPAGRIIARTSRHVCAVIDGVIHDNHDPSRDGTRCVYGYWSVS